MIGCRGKREGSGFRTLSMECLDSVTGSMSISTRFVFSCCAAFKVLIGFSVGQNFDFMFIVLLGNRLPTSWMRSYLSRVCLYVSFLCIFDEEFYDFVDYAIANICMAHLHMGKHVTLDDTL